jgi:hypothetical protein
MFYPNIGGEHKNMLVKFPLKINALSSCCYLSKFLLQKETWGYAKVIHKKRVGKNGHKVSKMFKTMGNQVPICKKEINNIAPVL